MYYPTHPSEIKDVAPSPDDSQYLVACGDKTVSLIPAKDPSVRPQRLATYVCERTPTCCCWSTRPEKQTIFYAGFVTGVVWIFSSLVLDVPLALIPPPPGLTKPISSVHHIVGTDGTGLTGLLIGSWGGVSFWHEEQFPMPTSRHSTESPLTLRQQELVEPLGPLGLVTSLAPVSEAPGRVHCATRSTGNLLTHRIATIAAARRNVDNDDGAGAAYDESQSPEVVWAPEDAIGAEPGTGVKRSYSIELPILGGGIDAHRATTGIIYIAMVDPALLPGKRSCTSLS